ncbi:MAG: diguanylate cyclase [Caldilineaceae bacterium]|nr:diguanylate cyclase [Caldilineaceae bacterium]
MAALREAITLCEANTDELLLAEALVELGNALEATHEFDAAMAALQRAQALHEQLDQPEWQVRTYRIIGRVHIGLGNYGDALHNLVSAMQLAENLGFDRLDRFFHTQGHIEQCLLSNTIAAVYANMGEFAKAIQQYRMVVRQARKPHPKLAAKALYNMGVSYEELDNLPSALDAYQEALKRQEAMADHVQTYITLIGIGRVYLAMGILGAARAALLQATTGLRGDMANVGFFADALHALGESYYMTKDYSAAIDCFRQVEKLHQATQRPAGALAWLHHNLYLAHKAAGDFEHALFHHEICYRLNNEHQEKIAAQQIHELMVKFDTEQAIKDRETLYLRSAQLEQQIVERRGIEAALAAAKAELEQRNQELERLSKIDPLTEVYNRRYLNETLSQYVAEARKYEDTLSVMICDVDNFKEINDRFSHVVGDEVLRIVARLFQDNLRPTDTVARYGGEEFVVIFPAAFLGTAAVLTERLLDAVRDYPWRTLHPELAVTLSAGLAQYVDQSDYEKLIHQADQELYRAKRNGKDCYSPVQRS